jgi:O-antigen/teichoic acid export membrane protein
VREVEGSRASAELAGAAAPSATTDRQEVRGVRAGTIVFAGIAVANGGNYLFHLGSARLLGPASYGDVASLAALLGLVTLPLVGVQLAVARYAARFNAIRDERALHGLFRRGLGLALAVGLGLTAVLTVLSLPVREVLGIDSLAAVVLTMATAAPAFLAPVVWGVAQGLQRFTLLSLATALGPALRPLLAVALISAGGGVAAAMGATLVAAVIALVIPLWFLRHLLPGGASGPGPIAARELGSYLVPVVVGVLSITSLTSVDVLVAKGAFSDDEAGFYGSASLIGRVILFLPSAIVLVLLPKVSARETTGRESRDILAKSLVVTGGFCLFATVLYVLAPRLLVFLAFGSEFEDAADLLWMFALAMSGYALLNVLLAYHLGRGSGTFSWLLLAGALLQIVGYAIFHASAEQVLTVSISVAFTLLAAHELVVERSIFRRGLLAPQ